MKKTDNGFTLVEMLVVLCIIGILMGALLAGFSHVTRAAQKARAQELVSNVHTALCVMLQTNGVWPLGPDKGETALKDFSGSDGNGKGCNEKVARLFAQKGLLGINVSGNVLKGVDRCGIVSPWAQNVLKRSVTATAATPVPTGGTVRDHIIYYALDTDMDGIVEAKVCGENVKVRDNAIVWCAGADGKLGSSYRKRSKENQDNVYSWRRNQEVFDK